MSCSDDVGDGRDDDDSVMLFQVCHVEMMLVMVEIVMTVYVVTDVSCRDVVGDGRDDDDSVMLLQVCHVEMMMTVLCCYRCAM